MDFGSEVLSQGTEDAIVETCLALSSLALDHAEVSEVDLNPVILEPHGAVAVDALVVIGSG